MARYICRKDVDSFKRGDTVEEVNGNLVDGNGKFICRSTSYRCHQCFIYDGDGQSKQREELIKRIFRKLRPLPRPAQAIADSGVPNPDEEWHEAERKKAWAKIWDDEKCQPFRKQDIPDDHWLWAHSFYVAPIEDLQYIVDLIGA